MPFWKKSEDPWDMDPEKKRRKAAPAFEAPARPEEENGEEESLLSELAGLFAKKEEEPEEPVPCPYCGEMMKTVYLKGNNGVYWSETKPGFLSAFDEAWLLSDEGVLTGYKTCRLCEACRKLIVDIPEHTGPNYVWENGQPKSTEQKEETGNDL